MSKPTLLIPVVFPEPDVYPLDDGNIVGLSGFDVILFGYWGLPEGVSREAAREQHESEAQAVLYEMAAAFSRAGATTSVRLYFGREVSEEAALQEHIVGETDADAVLVGSNISMWNNVLVPLRDDRHQTELVAFLSGLDSDSIFTLELYHVVAESAEVDPSEESLERVRTALVEAGFAEDVIKVTIEVRDDVGDAIAEQAKRHNLVVMGETEELPSEAKFLGPVYHELAAQAEVPVVVLRD